MIAAARTPCARAKAAAADDQIGKSTEGRGVGQLPLQSHLDLSPTTSLLETSLIHHATKDIMNEQKSVAFLLLA
jgi:hypothetical protein